MSQIENLKQFVAKNPNSLLSQFGLAKAYMEAGDYAAAAHHFREAIRIKPDYTAAFRFLGQALEKNQQNKEAIAVYQQGIMVAQQSKDIEAGKVMQVFLKRLESHTK